MSRIQWRNRNAGPARRRRRQRDLEVGNEGPADGGVGHGGVVHGDLQRDAAGRRLDLRARGAAGASAAARRRSPRGRELRVPWTCRLSGTGPQPQRGAVHPRSRMPASIDISIKLVCVVQKWREAGKGRGEQLA
jgi:hypothetical protein